MVSLESDPANISGPRGKDYSSPTPNCRREAAPGPLNGRGVWRLNKFCPLPIHNPINYDTILR